MASSNFSNELVRAAARSKSDDTSDDEVQRIAHDVMHNELPVSQLPLMVEIRSSYEGLQTSLQALLVNDLALNQVNRNTSVNIANLEDNIQVARSTSRIADKIHCHNSQIPPEVIDAINTEGQVIRTSMINVFQRTLINLQENFDVLQAAVRQNPKTESDPEIRQLLQEHIEITSNMPSDPRQAYQQIQRAIESGGRVADKIREVETDPKATVNVAADGYMKYLKLTSKITLGCAAVIAVCAGLWWVGIAAVEALTTGGLAASAAKVGIGLGASATVAAFKEKDRR
jgi:predicted metalloenzyme YecM